MLFTRGCLLSERKLGRKDRRAFADAQCGYFGTGRARLSYPCSGILVGKRDGLDTRKCIFVGVINAMIGLLIVAMKIFIH